MTIRGIKNGEADQVLGILVGLLLLFGLIMIASAGVAYGQSRFHDSYFFFKRQIVGVGVGLAIWFVLQRINYNFWKKIAFFLFLISLAFLLLVFVPGVGNKIYGASRWIQLGPFSFQPSEMLKLSLIIYLAAWLETRGGRIADFIEGVIPFLIIVGGASILLIKQPDIGTLGAVVAIAISMFFVSGAKMSHLVFMGFMGVMALFILIKIEPYRMDRLMIFINPQADSQGSGYQINQALLAIGSGGFFGRGLGHSLQKFNYLPEPVGDSIFAVLGEELGFVGCFVLIGLFVVLAMRGLKIAKGAPDNFSRLLAVGITAWIFFQAFINIAAISGLIPLTGIPLPFVSYGGTSIVFLMAGVGILMNISRYAKINETK